MSGGFFRGTSSDQDSRFSNKHAKLLKSQKFPAELDEAVDMSKVKVDVIKPWVVKRVTELLGMEDEVLCNFIFGFLEQPKVDGKFIQIQITGFLEKNTGRFMKELWTLLLSAQKNISGIPQQFLDEKAEETKKRKEEEEHILSELSKRHHDMQHGSDLTQKLSSDVEAAKKAASEAAARLNAKLREQGVIETLPAPPVVDIAAPPPAPSPAAAIAAAPVAATDGVKEEERKSRSRSHSRSHSRSRSRSSSRSRSRSVSRSPSRSPPRRQQPQQHHHSRASPPQRRRSPPRRQRTPPRYRSISPRRHSPGARGGSRPMGRDRYNGGGGGGGGRVYDARQDRSDYRDRPDDRYNRRPDRDDRRPLYAPGSRPGDGRRGGGGGDQYSDRYDRDRPLRSPPRRFPPSNDSQALPPVRSGSPAAADLADKATRRALLPQRPSMSASEEEGSEPERRLPPVPGQKHPASRSRSRSQSPSASPSGSDQEHPPERRALPPPPAPRRAYQEERERGVTEGERFDRGRFERGRGERERGGKGGPLTRSPPAPPPLAARLSGDKRSHGDMEERAREREHDDRRGDYQLQHQQRRGALPLRRRESPPRGNAHRQVPGPSSRRDLSPRPLPPARKKGLPAGNVEDAEEGERGDLPRGSDEAGEGGSVGRRRSRSLSPLPLAAREGGVARPAKDGREARDVKGTRDGQGHLQAVRARSPSVESEEDDEGEGEAARALRRKQLSARGDEGKVRSGAERGGAGGVDADVDMDSLEGREGEGRAGGKQAVREDRRVRDDGKEKPAQVEGSVKPKVSPVLPAAGRDAGSEEDEDDEDDADGDDDDGKVARAGGAGLGEKRKAGEEGGEDDASLNSHERREAKRRRKEEKRAKKEEKRRRKEEKRKRKEEKKAAKEAKAKKATGGGEGGVVAVAAGGEAPPPLREKGATDENVDVESGDEPANRDQKLVEEELRKKALESLRAKKAGSL